MYMLSSCCIVYCCFSLQASHYSGDYLIGFANTVDCSAPGHGPGRSRPSAGGADKQGGSHGWRVPRPIRSDSASFYGLIDVIDRRDIARGVPAECGMSEFGARYRMQRAFRVSTRSPVSISYARSSKSYAVLDESPARGGRPCGQLHSCPGLGESDSSLSVSGRWPAWTSTSRLSGALVARPSLRHSLTSDAGCQRGALARKGSTRPRARQ